MANAIKYLSMSLPISKIIAITVSGYAARVVSSQMLPQPIIAISNNRNIARTFNIFQGTREREGGGGGERCISKNKVL